ncbi:hypothetical protein EA772_14390 [Pedobacter sp. G11]|uniref:hypothetical protein n=1 Tax=Pedobacter sp. G11 TaxID=2482728 RepID=UPI000F5E69A9|nr:hypothetical protein [Pedobacter sp. G11]AZI26468.1 hypothetical protein EA772_14390 [Pedobacter sp. G11]
MLDCLFTRQHSDDGNDNIKRLHDQEYFERFFAVTVPPKVNIYDQLEHFFLKDTNKAVLLASAMSNGKMPELLGRLSDENLSSSYALDSLNIFTAYIDFFSSREEPANMEESLLRIKAYFNLVRLFKDQHRATIAALDRLKLERDKTDRTAFLFLHLLVRKFASLNLPQEVERYIHLHAGRLNENLLVYPEGHNIAQFYTISDGSPNWIDNLFLIGLMEDDRATYLNEMTGRMSPKLIWLLYSIIFLCSETENPTA